jgi:ribose 1,5-bisphosphokinase
MMAVEAQRTSSTEPIGPGRLVLVVGPSGAGKDTLIAQARARCRDNSDIVFPRRIVTRVASSAEDHDTVSEAEFEQMLAAGRFSLHWRAHGLKYALPCSLDDDIGAGRTVVCNVSRTIVVAARERYARVAAVLITAPVQVLAARLAQRGRETEASILTRLGRSDPLDMPIAPDHRVENAADVDSAAICLLGIICEQTLPRPGCS